MLCIALADNTEEICNPLHYFLRSMGSRSIYQHLFPAVCSSPPIKLIILKVLLRRGATTAHQGYSHHLSLLNFTLIYFSGTQLGTDFPALFLFPTFSYPSQQGSAFFDVAFFVAAFFVAAFLGAAFFVVAIKMFLKQNQRISQNFFIKKINFLIFDNTRRYM